MCRFSRLPNAFGPTIHHPIGFPSNSTGFPPFPPTIPSVQACHSYLYPTPLGFTPNPSAHPPGLPTHPLFNSDPAGTHTHIYICPSGLHALICTSIPTQVHPPICQPSLLSDWAWSPSLVCHLSTTNSVWTLPPISFLGPCPFPFIPHFTLAPIPPSFPSPILDLSPSPPFSPTGDLF